MFRLLTALLVATAPAPGADGLGDPYFPLAGNGGYDVAHYDLAVTYDPVTSTLTGTTGITATASQDLSRFDLDFAGPPVGDVTVNGRPASYDRNGHKLVITPARNLASGSRFFVRVAYRGRPGPATDLSLGATGWLGTASGAVTLSEPIGSETWFPVNDHPSDKATYDFRVTVPRGLQVLANGEEAGRSPGGAGLMTYHWSEQTPMASYLAMIAIGRFRVRSGRTPGGIPETTAVPATGAYDLDALYQETSAAIDWESKVFGPYPFRSTGGIVTDAAVGYSLETQGRPVYGWMPGQNIVVHELAHQWFGDSVSLVSWRDIWLNEGFATYAEWLWDEQHGGPSAQSRFDAAYQGPANWQIAPADPGRDRMFDGFAVYQRGAMTLQALRSAVGDATFFAILRDWTAQYRNAGATTADFVTLAERVSGRDLGPLFQSWLQGTSKPPA
jgi:aminopeptidase N